MEWCNFKFYIFHECYVDAFEARHDFLLSRLKLDYSQVSAELGVGDNPLTSRTDVTDLTQKLLALKAQ